MGTPNSSIEDIVLQIAARMRSGISESGDDIGMTPQQIETLCEFWDEILAPLVYTKLAAQVASMTGRCSEEPTPGDPATPIETESADANEASRIRNVLLVQEQDPEVAELLTELDSGELNSACLRRVLAVYRKYYNLPGDKFYRKLEAVLRALKSHSVKLVHCQIHSPARTAVGFVTVRRHYMRGKLNAEEIEKVRAATLIRDEAEGAILFELCPQVYCDGAVVYPGIAIIN